MTPRPTLAVVSDNQHFAQALVTVIGETFDCTVRPGSTACEFLHDVVPDVLVLDARDVTDGGHGLARMLDEVRRRCPSLPCLVLRGARRFEPLERHVACLGLRSLDEPFQLADVIQQITEFTDAARSGATEKAPGTSSPLAPLGRREIVSRQFETKSVHVQTMLDDLAIAADHDVTILLVGETGSGKTHLSRLIHQASGRSNEPFLHVACGALPRDLIESELFGHVKGAFTSAHADKEGKFLAAGKGTVLLDEIDVLGPEQQVKLLRVIETGQFEPIGSNNTVSSEARLIVASNLDLQPLVDQGRFRPDLYYRLNMLKFVIPPLRKRPMDIVPLAKKFIRKFQDKHRINIVRVEDRLLDALTEYPWPGNVRELENVIQRAVIYCRDGILTRRHLPEHVITGTAGPANDPSVRLGGSQSMRNHTLGSRIALTEREIIEQALFQNNYSKTRTAQSLGISRVTLYNKLKKLEISN